MRVSHVISLYEQPHNLDLHLEVMLRYSLLFPDSVGNCIGDRGLDTGWSQVPYLAQGENVKLLLSHRLTLPFFSSYFLSTK